jgi:hypothetical protein
MKCLTSKGRLNHRRPGHTLERSILVLQAIDQVGFSVLSMQCDATNLGECLAVCTFLIIPCIQSQ